MNENFMDDGANLGLSVLKISALCFCFDGNIVHERRKSDIQPQ
jgi:hypothetical protein